MQVSSVSSASSTPSQVQEVRPGDGAGNTRAANAQASAPPPPPKSSDSDADDGGSQAASTALTRSSTSVQEALLNLQTG